MNLPGLPTAVARPPHLVVLMPNLRAGGAERVMTQLANGFAAQGIQVTLILITRTGEFLSEVDASVHIVDLQAKRVLTGLLPLLTALNRLQPTAVLSALTHTNIAACVASMAVRVPFRLVICEHNSIAFAKKQSRYWGLMVWAMRLTYWRASAVVGVSSKVVAELAALIPGIHNQTWVAPNPVVTPALLARSWEAVAHPWFAEHDTQVVLAVGRLISEKGFDTLIDAFAKLPAHLHAKLIILGEGPMRAALEAHIKARGVSEAVDLHGFVDNPYAWMRKARLFVLASQHEGLPSVLIEAMACSVPVIATDCPHGPAEILGDGQWGQLVPVDSVDAMAEALTHHLQQVPTPESLSAAKTRAGEYSLAASLKAYGQVLFPKL